MEYLEFATDQQIYDSGLGSRQAYQRAFHAQQRLRRDSERIAVNTAVGYEARRSDRFMPAGSSGVPVTKVKWKQEADRALEEQARKHYAEFVAFNGFESEAGRNAAANLGNLLGYTVRTGNEFSAYIRSDEARKRFMEG
jgi:hypothetical protein